VDVEGVTQRANIIRLTVAACTNARIASDGAACDPPRRRQAAIRAFVQAATVSRIMFAR
jgi:hypothetical protein